MKNIFSLPLFLGLLLALSACSSTNVQQTYTASGSNGYQISCGGIFGGGDVSTCYLAAGKTCGEKGYNITHTGVSSIIISCKNPDDLNAPVEAIQK